ncbi:hypothetical protein [Flavobacterium frigidarium]|uniref:hypothetical protein n=1 Tax=Flavobacterium frigidarium TaxID=99286 RepID=UPI000409CA1E|nr:hypothetical protein [Flavobacterium frigidarium]
MNNRDVFIKEFRSETIGSVGAQSSAEEQFQNEVLRPILKLQNELFIASFKSYIAKNKGDFANFTLEKKNAFVENSIQKDTKYRNTLKGFVVGLFTLQEYETYASNTSNLNKRIMSMLQERLKSQLQLF